MGDDVVIEEESIVLDGAASGWTDSAAALDWRVTRRINDRLPTVEVSARTAGNVGGDLSAIAFGILASCA